MEIAIIGAGMAGLTCGRALAGSGHSVRLFDKGRGPGGRMSTRRAQTPLGECRFDHGAQLIVPATPEFAAEVDRWVAAGAAAPWQGEFATVSASGDLSPEDDLPRHVGTPSMNAIIRHLADGVAVDWGRRVSAIAGTPGAYRLAFEDPADGPEGPFEAVLVAVPAEQAGPLLARPAPDFARLADGTDSDPCWCVMLAFDTALEAPFDAASFTDGPLAWAARNSSKPGRGPAETWVLQASADWSRQHLEDPPEEVAAALTEAFAPPEAPVHAGAHRWRYSQVNEPAGAGALWDRARGIGACGDWLSGRQVEDAWSSGHALAKRIATD